ncbi:HYC_CC_PP family protein [Filimonas effusa]|uniref:Membrane or secreted protein n=1 Tax=Filimonas effusa TaxID=2508721 RepID=A0A4Q1DAQ8_9BACT|nr:hypothetical protein [Filimonas effusa]RXK85643.1 hypothetical protein ESB13_02180 [Filimonas effusa]
MKKLLVFILTFLYMGASTGTTLHLHYCMGKLVQEEQSHKETSRCSKCGMKKGLQAKKGCCKDEHKLVKIEKDQQAASQISLPDYFVAVLPPSLIEAPVASLPFATAITPVSHAPPQDMKPLHSYILYCSLLI